MGSATQMLKRVLVSLLLELARTFGDSLRTELEIKNTLGCVRAWATVCVVGLGVACKVQGWVVTALGGFSKTWLCEWGRDAREYAARG